MRHYSRLSTSPDRGLLQGLAVPVGVHLLSKGSWNHLHLANFSCCFWEQVKPREFFFPVLIIFAVYFMRSFFFLISKTFWGSEDIVMPLPFSLLIPPRSAKSGHVYACGTFHLGSGEEAFWSQQEEDGRETERLWFWGKNERAQRRGKALLSLHLLSPSFEFCVTNQEEASSFHSHPQRIVVSWISLYWGKHLLSLFGTVVILRIWLWTYPFFPGLSGPTFFFAAGGIKYT